SNAAGDCLRGNGPASSWQAFLRDGDRRLPLAARTLPADVVLRASRPRLEFWPDAFAASTITLTICDAQGVGRPRAIVVSQTGRVRLGAVTDAGCGA
ncbi:MAG TPA: GspH/FimT family pseudopilin, partial [Steroidobacteraceae bacterium]|nr:GspH/FimT family pseudopilin [Steroidobacteraceae bacterium]